MGHILHILQIQTVPDVERIKHATETTILMG